MSRDCAYCRGPIAGVPVRGRSADDQLPAEYCCFGCLSLGESKSRRSAGPMIRIGIGLLIAGQSMIFGLAINLEDNTPRSMKLGVQGVILAGTLLVVALLGWPLMRTAASELRRGRLTIEALFLITLAGAMAASLQSMIAGVGPIYFEVVSVLLVVYSIGKLIGARNRDAALASTRAWSAGLSKCRLADERTVEVASIRPGDVVLVRAGETIAVDGVVHAGTGFVHEAAINGEPFAAVKRPGDRVFAGGVSQDAVFQIEATAPGTARHVDQLLEAVEAARRAPSSMQAAADRLVRFFLPLVVLIAGVTFAVWTQRTGWREGLFNAMSVLLVACPCALGLATPIVLWTTLSRMAERGLSVRGGDTIERLAQVDRVVFDKTGTLTEERFGIVDIATFAENEERARILNWLLLVESRSSHPIARAFAALPSGDCFGKTPELISHHTIPGCGIEAEISDAGARHRLRIGRSGWLESSAGPEAEDLLKRLRTRNGHRIDIEIDGRLAAVAVVSERLRDSAQDAIASIHGLGLPVCILTGDSSERASSLGLKNVEGSLLPEDKRKRLADGRALMIGDGINDASALAAAHVGIALGCGTDLANNAAAATLHHGDLRTIPWAINECRQAMRTVRTNLIGAAAYNLIGISLAAFGLLHPVAAALIMAASSLTVAWTSVRSGQRHRSADRACEHGTAIRTAVKSSRSAGEWARAVVHVAAFACQAVCVVLLIGLSAESFTTLLMAFVAAGALAGYWWLRSPYLPHWLDMSFGMLTLGNLGMLAGWWLDNGCRPLEHGSCFVCVEALRASQFKPGMLVGMLAGANVAMFFLARRPVSKADNCQIAMLTGGNVGMIVGMFAGGWVVAGLATGSVVRAFVFSLAGMTVGMIPGMLAGTAAARFLISLARPESWDRLQSTDSHSVSLESSVSKS